MNPRVLNFFILLHVLKITPAVQFIISGKLKKKTFEKKLKQLIKNHEKGIFLKGFLKPFHSQRQLWRHVV